MCDICDDWESGKLKIGQTLKKIAKRLKNPKTSFENTEHLWSLSDRILQEDAPQQDTNEALDKLWWNSTHKEEEDV